MVDPVSGVYLGSGKFNDNASTGKTDEGIHYSEQEEKLTGAGEENKGKSLKVLSSEYEVEQLEERDNVCFWFSGSSGEKWMYFKGHIICKNSVRSDKMESKSESAGIYISILLVKMFVL